MVWRKSCLLVVDSCGAIKSRCGGFFKKNNLAFSKSGDFIQVSVVISLPKAKKLKGRLHNAIIILTKKNNTRLDGSSFVFYKNNCALLKKRLTTYGKLISGPINFTIKRKRFTSSFSTVI